VSKEEGAVLQPVEEKKLEKKIVKPTMAVAKEVDWPHYSPHAGMAKTRHFAFGA